MNPFNPFNPLSPLSPFTYTLRHKRRTLMLTALLALAVAGLHLLAGLMHGTYIAPFYAYVRHLRTFSLVQPNGTGTLDPTVAAQIRVHPDVAQVLPQNNVVILTKSVGGSLAPCRLMGLQQAHMAQVLAHSGVTLVEGQLPQPHTNGVALSKEVAAALDLEIGDTTDSTEDDYAYRSIVSPLEVVGILSGDIQGVVSYEYLDSHERYRDLASYGVLVTAHPGREAAVDDFLQQAILSSHTEIHTYQIAMKEASAIQAGLNAMLIPVVLLATAAITLVIGAVNRLAFLRRLPEFGTLHAIGHAKEGLMRHLTLETAGMAVAGWVTGILASLGAMILLNTAVYTPRGFAYDPIQGSAFLLVIPLPLAVIGSTLLTATRVLGRMDTVAIVERGELSLEAAGRSHGRPGRGRAASLSRPLASTTFYRRHTGQAVTLIGSMALMVVGTASIIFWSDAAIDVPGQIMVDHLIPVSRISPKGRPLDTTVIAQVRTHPAVERTIPVYSFSPLNVSLPLLPLDWPVDAYAATAEDLGYLVDLYGLQLAEGHLPRPNTNEIAIPWAVAKNRDIQVGDVIGDRAHPIYPDAPTLPSPLTISGIFAPAQNSAGEHWVSFVSQEFLNDYQEDWRNELSLIVVPKAGQRETLDGWLESQLAGDSCTVFTYGKQKDWWQGAMNAALFTASLMDSVIAAVAALALAGLNTIFVAQRRAEFGVLNAMGLSRRQLVWRVVREALFTTSAAWLVGLLGCAVMLACLEQAAYAPVGLRLDFFDPMPWFYTLPVPVAVLAASAGTIARALKRLDPVAVIEGR